MQMSPRPQPMGQQLGRWLGKRLGIVLLAPCDHVPGRAAVVLRHVHRSRDDRDARRYGGVTAGEFDALVEDLVAKLEEFDVPRAEQEELLGLLGPMRDEIVEVESPETGTPLPDNYQPAPALT